MNTTGYRGQVPAFRAVLVETARRTQGAWERLVNEHAVLNGSRLDLRQGNLERTGNPLDFAIEGPGFFAVQTRAGTLYTRNGSFRVSASGQLVNSAGEPVLGSAGAIRLPQGEVAISPDGTVSVNGAIAGKLQVFEFAADAELTPTGATYYSAPGRAAKTAVASSVRQGMLESSNVSPVAAMVSLITAQRQAEMVERAMSAFYSDFNRIAAGELPRT